jgi:hypothetical protein
MRGGVLALSLLGDLDLSLSPLNVSALAGEDGRAEGL